MSDIYFSARTRDWVAARIRPRISSRFKERTRPACWNTFRSAVVLDENATVETLQQYPVVCLANTGIVSEREVAMFQAYVAQGGNLLITGQSGQYDSLGRPMQNTSLAELIGATVVRRLESADNWVRFPTGPGEAAKQGEENRAAALRIGDGIPGDWPFLVEGPATVYQPTTAVPIGELMTPHRMPSQLRGELVTDWPLSADKPVGPALLVNRVGKGTVATFAASPDYATASEHHIVEVRQLFHRVVRMLHPDPIVIVTAPANVEAVVTDDVENRTLRVHLIAYNPTPQTTPAKNRPYILPGLVEDRPIYRASIQSARPIAEAKTVNESTTLKQTGNRLDLTVDDIHEVVLIRY